MNRLKTWLDRRQHCMTEAAAAFGITPPRGILLLCHTELGQILLLFSVAPAYP
ncbi:MAG TPA: hypothetical protein VGI81_09160 [Tepidisphaeraceae bacterium]